MEKIKEIWKDKPIWLRIILLFLGTYVLKRVILSVSSFIIMLIYNIPGYMDYFEVDPSEFAETVGLYITVAYMFIAAVLVLLVIKPYRPIFKTLGRKMKGNTIKMFLIGGAIGLGANSIVVGLAVLRGELKLEFYKGNFGAFLVLFIIMILQCLAEEFIHRAIILQVTAKYFKSPILIIGLSSVLFGAGHMFHPGANYYGVASLCLLGAVCGAFVYYADSFWAAVAVHGLWNYSQGILWGVPNSGQLVPYTIFRQAFVGEKDTFFYSPAFGPEGTMMAVILLGLATAAVIYWGVKNNRKMTNIWENEITTK